MTSPAVFWPAALGVLFLAIGIATHWRDVSTSDLGTSGARGIVRILPLGPALVAAALAAFAGEHFTAAPSLAQIIPTFIPGRLFLAYFVGVAHLAAALSFVARRYVRLSSVCLAAMFALFVLLMDLPAAVRQPGVRIFWVLAAREATFAIGALALYVVATCNAGRHSSAALAAMAMVGRIWTACVLVFYGIANAMYPQLTPGVPATIATAAWVPAPQVIAYVTGALLIMCGLAMLAESTAASGAAWSGLTMTVLTAALYVPQFFIASTAAEEVRAINFIFDTLLFGGMMFVVGSAVAAVARAEIVAADSGAATRVIPN